MDELNKFLTEAMGDCWHEIEKAEVFTGGPIDGSSHWTDQCNKCKKEISYMPTFSDWYDFGKLWGWAIKQDWWGSFIYSQIEDDSQKDMIRIELVEPEKFAKAVADFLKN